MKRIIITTIANLIFAGSAFAGSATLTWTANTESDLAGYKVYRGLQTCADLGPLQPLMVGSSQVTVLKPATTYRDGTVPAIDGSVAYQITAFDTSGNESTKSNCAAIVVATPPAAPTGLSVTYVP